MSSKVFSALRLLALVVALPAACLAAVLFYGKTMSEAEVAEAHLPTPEEARARITASIERFAAMTPAQHLEAARAAIHSATVSAGPLDGAEQHLRAIAASAPEHASVAAMMTELTRRRAEIHEAERRRREALFDDAARVVASHVADTSRDDDDRRESLARELDQMSSRGLGCVHAFGDDAEVLTFSLCECDRAMLDRVARPEQRRGIYAMGFRSLRCVTGGLTVPLSQ